MLFSLSHGTTAQALEYVLMVSSSSEIAPQKHFCSWQKYYYYFLGTGKWSLDAGELPHLEQACSRPLGGGRGAVGLCFLSQALPFEAL